MPERRKIFMLEDEPSIRNLLLLVKRLNPGNGNSVLASVTRKQFDSVMLDLRCSSRQLENEIHGIRDVLPSLVGKMLVITAEVRGPKTLRLVERYLTNGLPRTLLWLICPQ